MLAPFVFVVEVLVEFDLFLEELFELFIELETPSEELLPLLVELLVELFVPELEDVPDEVLELVPLEFEVDSPLLVFENSPVEEF